MYIHKSGNNLAINILYKVNYHFCLFFTILNNELSLLRTSEIISQHSILRVIMAESVENSGSDKITITVKTPKEKHEIQVIPTSTVKEVNVLNELYRKCRVWYYTWATSACSLCTPG